MSINEIRRRLSSLGPQICVIDGKAYILRAYLLSADMFIATQPTTHTLFIIDLLAATAQPYDDRELMPSYIYPPTVRELAQSLAEAHVDTGADLPTIAQELVLSLRRSHIIRPSQLSRQIILALEQTKTGLQQCAPIARLRDNNFDQHDEIFWDDIATCLATLATMTVAHYKSTSL